MPKIEFDIIIIVYTKLMISKHAIMIRKKVVKVSLFEIFFVIS